MITTIAMIISIISTIMIIVLLLATMLYAIEDRMGLHTLEESECIFKIIYVLIVVCVMSSIIATILSDKESDKKYEKYKIEQEKIWNDGVCIKDNGHWHLLEHDNSKYFWECENCGRVFETKIKFTD